MNLNLRPVITSGFLIGLGMGGAIDRIILFHLLQLQILINRSPKTIFYENLESNMFLDGLFQLSVWTLTLIGIFYLWKISSKKNRLHSTRALVSGMLSGWGCFNLLEGLSDYNILKVHETTFFIMNTYTFKWSELLIVLGVIQIFIAFVFNYFANRNINIKNIVDNIRSLSFQYKTRKTREEIFEDWFNPRLLEQWFHLNGMDLNVHFLMNKEKGGFRFIHQSRNETFISIGVFNKIFKNKKLEFFLKTSGSKGQLLQDVKVSVFFDSLKESTLVKVELEGFFGFDFYERSKTFWSEALNRLTKDNVKPLLFRNRHHDSLKFIS